MEDHNSSPGLCLVMGEVTDKFKTGEPQDMKAMNVCFTNSKEPNWDEPKQAPH